MAKLSSQHAGNRKFVQRNSHRTRADIAATIAETADARRKDVYKMDAPHAYQERTRRRYTAEEKESLLKDIIIRRDAGLSYLDIATELNLSTMSVRDWYLTWKRDYDASQRTQTP